MGGGGTELFPNLGAHCDHEDCGQLDFLPFLCDGCQKDFCAEHRGKSDHGCPAATKEVGRTVALCEACGTATERAAGEGEEAALRRHASSGACDPAKKKKPRCPVPRCKGQLTFSNRSCCKVCGAETCLAHRFHADHVQLAAAAAVKLPSRAASACRSETKAAAAARSPSAVRAF